MADSMEGVVRSDEEQTAVNPEEKTVSGKSTSCLSSILWGVALEKAHPRACLIMSILHSICEPF